jgi:hypothetical protein
LPTSGEALAFAAPDRDYLRAGLGGNHLGATFSIADFEAPAPSVAPAGQGPAVTTRVTALP